MYDPENISKLNTLIATSIILTFVIFDGLLDCLGETFHMCLCTVTIINWVLTVIYATFVIRYGKEIYYVDFDKSKQIIFYIPRTRHHYTQTY